MIKLIKTDQHLFWALVSGIKPNTIVRQFIHKRMQTHWWIVLCSSYCSYCFAILWHYVGGCIWVPFRYYFGSSLKIASFGSSLQAWFNGNSGNFLFSTQGISTMFQDQRKWSPRAHRPWPHGPIGAPRLHGRPVGPVWALWGTCLVRK